MRQLTPEQIGIDYEALLRLLGEERAMKLIGEERAIDLIGEEQVVEDLVRRKGEQWLREMLERVTKKPDADGEPQPPAPTDA